jgi:IMP dehydrogenase
VAEVEIGLGKSGRRAYGFDELSIVPSRRTRDPEDIDLSWEIDAFAFDLPVIAAAMDGVTSPATAIEIGRLGGVALLNLEGLWTRYDDPAPLFDEIGELTPDKVTVRLQEIYQEPIKPELVTARLREIRDAGAVAAGAVTPQRTARLADAIIDGEPDLLVIQGTVVSAEHVSKNHDPLNLKTFVRALDLPVLVGGCSSYQAALHLMRTGAAGVLVGVGANHACTGDAVLGIGAPQATAVADVRAARMRHLDETGVYVHVIANGGLKTGGDIAKAIVCGADAVVLGTALAHAHEAPGKGFSWGNASFHSSVPHGTRIATPPIGTLDEILFGPDRGGDGGLNLMGALRASMALTGYATIKDLQKADLTVSAAPAGPR